MEVYNMKRSIFEKLKKHSLNIIFTSIGCGMAITIGYEIGSLIFAKAGIKCIELLFIFFATVGAALIFYSIVYVALDKWLSK